MTLRTKKYWESVPTNGYNKGMHWENLLAQRTELMPRSTIREFLKHAGRPGVISFAGGLPAPELFAVDAFREATERIFSRFPTKALQYGQTEGVPELREYLATKFNVAVENVLITTGAQQALDLIGRVLLDPGDIALVENPTYLSLLAAWRPLEVNFSGITMDSEGLQMIALRDALRHNPKLLYCQPNFQNPSGISLSARRREELIYLAAEHELLLVEDDAYGSLRYDGLSLPSLFELSRGKSVYAGTFSKVLAPGLRTGWIVAPRELIEAFVRAKQAMDLQTSTLNQYIALELVNAGVIEKQLPILKSGYKARRDAMLEALRKSMPPDCSWTIPEGGMFLLLTLPEGQSGREFSRAALEQNVLVVPGDDFHVSGGGNTLRLNFSNATPETIREGVNRVTAIAVAWQNAFVH